MEKVTLLHFDLVSVSSGVLSPPFELWFFYKLGVYTFFYSLCFSISFNILKPNLTTLTCNTFNIAIVLCLKMLVYPVGVNTIFTLLILYVYFLCLSLSAFPASLVQMEVGSPMWSTQCSLCLGTELKRSDQKNSQCWFTALINTKMCKVVLWRYIFKRSLIRYL